MHHKKTEKGFTLVEMLIVIGLIALLATTVLVAVNPSRQFKFARDTERKAHLTAILNAMGQNISEHQGDFLCNGAAFTFPQLSAVMESGGSSEYDIAPCLVPDYIPKLPVDPKDPGTHFYTSPTSYYSGYMISEDENGYITLEAQSEMNPSEKIKITR
jgi:prepilin-type N-terminal cleavage/methylation domain-containing protein